MVKLRQLGKAVATIIVVTAVGVLLLYAWGTHYFRGIRF